MTCLKRTVDTLREACSTVNT